MSHKNKQLSVTEFIKRINTGSDVTGIKLTQKVVCDNIYYLLDALTPKEQQIVRNTLRGNTIKWKN